MKKIEQLRLANSVSDLAALLNHDASSFAYLIYILPESQKYRTFPIPKKSGGSRIISAPQPELRAVQRKLAKFLQDCLDELRKEEEEIRGERNVANASHGFQRERSIITNAREHRRKQFVFNTDLEDFFPSINFGRVRGVFLKSKIFKLTPKVASAIAHIACYQGKLPQGSPLSPVISNLVAHVLDVELIKLARNSSCRYTRYADDLTFSTNMKVFPRGIAKNTFLDRNKWRAGSDLEKVILNCGFRLNHTKSRMQYYRGRQDVTGLVVNKKANVRADVYRAVRSQCHELFTKGEFYNSTKSSKSKKKKSISSIIRSVIDKIFYAQESPEDGTDKEEGTLNQLHGKLNFIYHVKSFSDERISTEKRDNPLAISKLYEKFLFFRNFYFNDKTVIICEGKTDIVYISSALKSLQARYPTLIQNNTNGKHTFNIKMFNYSSVTQEVLNLGGGTGDLGKLIVSYAKRINRYKCAGKMHPVIVLIDNDSGSRNDIYPKLSAITKSRVDGTSNFYTVLENLYVLPTPKINGKDSKIENLFKPATLATTLNGRSFDPDEKNTNAYGKNDFAEKVIKPNWRTIDFSDFQPVLDQIISIQANYQSRTT